MALTDVSATSEQTSVHILRATRCFLEGPEDGNFPKWRRWFFLAGDVPLPAVLLTVGEGLLSVEAFVPQLVQYCQAAAKPNSRKAKAAL